VRLVKSLALAGNVILANSLGQAVDTNESNDFTSLTVNLPHS
jgi:hypothetical protein